MPANKFVNLQPIFSDALEHHRLGRLQDAEQRYREILTVEPQHTDALCGLSMLAHQTGRNDVAIELASTAIRLKPEFAGAHSNLGAALNSLGRFDEAVAAFNTAVRLKPDYVDAHYNLGTALTNLRRFDEAIASFNAAVLLKPDYVDAYSNLGVVFGEMGRFEEAVAAYNTAIRLRPDHAVTHSNLGVALTELGRFDEAIAAVRTAIRLKPDLAAAHYAESVAHLLLGELSTGWPKYEWRWRGGDKALKAPRFTRPRWQGEEISGRMILLHAEQGHGDTIQFARYATMVAARGGRVILAAHPSLLRLLSGLAGVERLIAFGDPLPTFDYHCPLMSLPGVFGTTVDTIPANIPYLSAEGELVGKWRSRIGTADFKIGIAWQGTPHVTIDRGRSIPLACFDHLAKIPGVRLVSLQKGHGLEQLNLLPAGMRVETLGEDFDAGPDAFIDTAAAMMNLDLIVTADTSVGALAGALGRPVWLALKTVPHWVHMMNRLDSPWYPSARLFRQTERGGWDDVFRRMAAELTGRLEE
ncbi:MAG TPA: tetratricopeptide repeat protein [Rhizomicrobium sp.]|nr:tetratricopeptide repeat protein [Rhizomicrobium sp.]